jgi:hypothetical protein
MNICCEFPITKAVKSKRNEPKVMPALAQKKNHVADEEADEQRKDHILMLLLERVRRHTTHNRKQTGGVNHTSSHE